MPDLRHGAESELVTAEVPENHKLIDLTHRFWAGLVLAVPVFVMEMGDHQFAGGRWVAPAVSAWSQLALAA